MQAVGLVCLGLNMNMALPLITCVTLGKVPKISMLQFPYLQSEPKNSSYLVRLL